MARKRYTPEQIIRHLRLAEVLYSQGRSVSEICREIGVTENTYYRWRKEYGGMRINQAKRLKELERENSRLKRVVANLILDNLILNEVSGHNLNQSGEVEVLPSLFLFIQSTLSFERCIGVIAKLAI